MAKSTTSKPNRSRGNLYRVNPQNGVFNNSSSSVILPEGGDKVDTQVPRKFVGIGGTLAGIGILVFPFIGIPGIPRRLVIGLAAGFFGIVPRRPTNFANFLYVTEFVSSNSSWFVEQFRLSTRFAIILSLFHDFPRPRWQSLPIRETGPFRTWPRDDCSPMFWVRVPKEDRGSATRS